MITWRGPSASKTRFQPNDGDEISVTNWLKEDQRRTLESEENKEGKVVDLLGGALDALEEAKMIIGT